MGPDMSDQLNDFISKQHERDIVNADRFARIETLLEQNSLRLFGGDGQKGALPYMQEQHERVATRVGRLESWKSGTIKWIAGAVAVLTLEGSALAFYFNHVAGLVKEITQKVAPHVP